MLSGIKVGKAKPQGGSNPNQGNNANRNDPPLPLSSTGSHLPTSHASRKSPPSSLTPQLPSDNRSVAEQLRQALAQGKAPPVSSKPAPNVAAGTSLEARGRIQAEPRLSRKNRDHDNRTKTSVVVLDYDKKLPPPVSSKDENDWTVSEMLAYEKRRVDDDADVILRNTKKQKHQRRTVDSDEEEEQQLQNLRRRDDNDDKGAQREQSRQLARYDQIQSITAKCWWWLEATTSFQRHRLLALGDHVSLVLTPPNLALIPGQHFYLVPIQHASSLASCDDNVWNEIRLFQNSLRAMYKTNGKTILCTETVTTSLSSSSSFWQTKMDVMVVPERVGQDAPLFFKSALSEQAQELSGTHIKLYDTTQKGLRRTIPSQFSYFYLEYDGYGKTDSSNQQTTGGGTGQVSGMAQIIEERFPRDFAVDTIGCGMMQMDPIRFRRKDKNSEKEERQLVQAFLEQWKAFDWTVELDS